MVDRDFYEARFLGRALVSVQSLVYMGVVTEIDLEHSRLILDGGPMEICFQGLVNYSVVEPKEDILERVETVK